MYFESQFLLFAYHSFIKFCRRHHSKQKHLLLEERLHQINRKKNEDNIIKDISLFHLMHTVTHAHASMCTTGLMHIKKSMHDFNL